ncbi:hypothetical protein [Streptomyces sp. AC1-42W]|uniref:hypothetical protein n=1 Tax=Streptomyces sp. AC1-42W TaxID=2218666 RepID=UPI000DAB41A6|nr:hypothetical protein [Streptomyces sp. AC1-42W]PZT75631.1 hypothetical protein DNK56_19455 [Streptomyces sp. AC1-42W]
MSNSDQQHPYDPYRGQDAAYQDPYAYGQQQPQQPYGQQPQQPYAQDAYAQDAYGQDAYGQDAYAQPQQGYGYPAAPSGQGVAAQTWEGQTWDTQYQPPVPAAEPAPQAPQYQAPQAPAPQYAAPLGTGSYPLPPEVRPEPEPAPEPGVNAAADGYGPATTLGNARITDAQRARAEGRSPIIAPGIQPAAITAALGLLLALGAAIGSYALLVPLVLLQAVTAAGWFRLNGMWPARQGIALAFAGGLVADVALLAAGRENGPAAIIGTLGVWVLLTVVLQLRSRAGADERMQGLMATVASAALAVLAAGHLAAVPDAVTVGAVAVAAAVVVRALPLPEPVTAVAALAVAAVAGAVAGAVTDLGAKGALLGLAAGVCALIGLRAASYDYPSRFVHMTAGVALPLTAAAPAVYLLGRVLA